MRKAYLQTFFCAVLAVSVLLSACTAKPDETVYGTLSELHGKYTSVTRAQLGFMMEATFRDEDSGEAGTLYYMQGESRYDSAEDIAWQKFTATLLAATYNAEEYYADGEKLHLENGEEYRLESSADAFFGAFPYCTVPLPAFSDVSTLTAEPNGDATLYTLTASAGQKSLIEDVWQLDLYSLAGIVVPNRGKESFSDVTYTFSVKNGEIRSLTVKLTASIYETPGYTPGYTPNDEDYRLDLTVTAQISVKATGEAVEIPTYSEANE